MEIINGVLAHEATSAEIFVMNSNVMVFVWKNSVHTITHFSVWKSIVFSFEKKSCIDPFHS